MACWPADRCRKQRSRRDLLEHGAAFRRHVPGLVLQYFSLALNGPSVIGTLVEDHREESAAGNLLGHQVQLVACRSELGFYNNQSAIAEGTTVSGTITDQTVQLRIEGNIVDTTRPFVAEITANRTS